MPLALAGVMVGTVLALDFVSGVSAFRPGELSRMAYCLLGFGLAMMVLRRLLVKLLKSMLPKAAFEQVRYRLPITVVWLLCYTAIAYPYFLSYMQIHPPRSVGLSDPAMALRLDYANVSWRSFDETTLRGVVRIFASLRAAGLQHGDTKATNFIVTADGVFVVDLDALGPAKGSAGHDHDVRRFLENWREPGVRSRFQHALMERRIDGFENNQP